MSGTYTHNLIMSGNGSEQMSIPQGYAFLSITNNTDNTIYIFQEKRTVLEPNFALMKMPAYTAQTIPITTTRRDFTLFYQDGGGAGQKKAEFIFSEENLQINTVLGTAISGTVTVGSDGVGLARQAQFPASLTGSGNLKVAVQEGSISVASMSSGQLPAALSGSGNLKVSVQEQLPTGSNTIGTVNIGTMPSVVLGTGSNAVGKVALQAYNNSGATVGRVKAAATINATVVKASQANLLGLHLYNNTASAKFLKLYNKATAPAVASDTPVMTIPIPPNNFVSLTHDIGINFAAGLAYVITGAIGDTDATATAVDDVTGGIFYV